VIGKKKFSIYSVLSRSPSIHCTLNYINIYTGLSWHNQLTSKKIVKHLHDYSTTSEILTIINNDKTYTYKIKTAVRKPTEL